MRRAHVHQSVRVCHDIAPIAAECTREPSGFLRSCPGWGGAGAWRVGIGMYELL